MPILFRDIETRSTLNLPDVGAWRYAADPSTDVWCIAYAVDNEPVQLWIPGQTIPEEFHIAARDSDWIVVAHNDAFEAAVENLILAPRYGWPIVPIERHRCTMATALASALPARLDTVAEVLALAARKDDQGARLMKQLARPRKPRENEDPAGVYWIDDPEKLERLYAYCRNDVEVERELYHRLPPLADSEQALWVLDATINLRGFHTDGPLLEAASRIADAAGQAVQGELTRITDGALTTTDQVVAILAWLGEHGCEVKDLRKPTLKHALRRKELDPVARRVIELRLGAAHAAAAKIDALLAWRDTDGRVRGTLRFHGAGTGRWTGHGPQPQNFKRDSEGIDAKVTAVMNGGAGLDSPIEAVGDIARAMICAAPGHRLLVGDFSGIESRVTAWASGQQSKLDQWAKFDRTGDPKDEPYYILGRQCGQPEASARRTGKTADLAFGYMGGPGAWDRLAPEDDNSSDEDKKRYQGTWRSLHQRTVQFWHGIDRTAIAAIKQPSTAVAYKRFTLTYDNAFLHIVLPSGRALSYPHPRLEKGKFGDPMVVFKDNAGGKFVDCRYGRGAYGGLWTENIVQAVSRDLLAAAMMRLEAAGYPIVLHVHDEIVAEAPNDFGSIEEFQRLITTLPDWAEGLPIAAKVRNGERFSKSADLGGHDQREFDDEPADALDNIINENGESAGHPDSENSNSDTAANEHDRDHDEHDQNDQNGDQDHDRCDDDHAQDARSGNKGHDRRADDQGQHYPKGERRTGGRVATYLYRDHLGGNHTRVEKWRSSTATRAQYPQSFWSGGRWVSQKPKGWTKIPYHLPEMLAALAKDPGTDVYLPEGEKDADTIAALGLTATTNSEGATPLKAKTGKWAPELNKWFSGVRRLFILADNDEVGRAFAREKAHALETIVPDIRIVPFPDVPDGEDVSYWLNELGHSKAELIARCEATAPDKPPLPFINMSNWDSEPVPEQEWAVLDRIPLGQTTLFTGEGGYGKSTVQLHLCAAHTLSREWLGALPDPGPAIFFEAEDGEKTIHRRLAAIARHYETTFEAMLRGGLHVISLFGHDAVLATLARNGTIEPTPLYNQLLQAAGDIKPKMLGIASSANVFAGSEIDRTQTQQFIGLLNRLALTATGAVVLIAHPSLTGISSDTGLSGTTQWHNAVRARFYLKGIKVEAGEQPDNDLRELVFKKNQFGPMSANIVLHYQGGLFLPEAGVSSLDRAAQELIAEHVFLDLLKRFTAANRRVSDRAGTNYAPAIFAREAEAKLALLSSKNLEGAMRRLFADGKIWNEPHGKPSRGSFRIALKT